LLEIVRIKSLRVVVVKLTRTYTDRHEIVSGCEEIFFRRVKLWSGDAPPVFRIAGITFVHVQRNHLLFVITTRYNVSPVTYIEFLQSLTTLFKDYLGILNEETIRLNFGLLYELLDEVCEDGILQSTSTDITKSYVFNDPIEPDVHISLLDSIPLSVCLHYYY
jgi:AP-4 complex subunit mu-1